MGVDDLQYKAAEMVKKALTLGVGAFFLTEESLRGLISEIKLPKELIAAILESAGKTKADLLKTLPKEMMTAVLDRVDMEVMMDKVTQALKQALTREQLSQVAQDLMKEHEIDVRVRVRFHPKAKAKRKSG